MGHRSNDIVEMNPSISLEQQLLQKVLIHVILSHLFLIRHPIPHEIETLLLQLELLHLKRLHQERVDAIPTLRSGFGT